MEQWALQDAKAKFSEVVAECLVRGPQMVTRHGEPAVVIISNNEYQRLVKPRTSLLSFFTSAPRVELSIQRDSDLPRALDL